MKPPTGEIKYRKLVCTDMKAAELREIMEECQLPFKVRMSKADMVAVLDDYFIDEAEEPEDTDEHMALAPRIRCMSGFKTWCRPTQSIDFK